jgi:uncharacterized protein (TIGR03437 family)
MVSGSGQLVDSPSFQTTNLLVVQANDANGNPLPGVPIAWSSVGGNTPSPTLVTGANGQASTDYTSPSLQPGSSFLETTVTATSKYGSVTFFVINVPFINNGEEVTPPSIQLLKPTPGATLTALPGSTLPGAVQVSVRAGTGGQTNAPLPNVSVHLVNGADPTIAPAAQCNGPGGYVYTDATGTATCNLVVTGQPGVTALAADVGQYQTTTTFELQINAGAPCTYSLSPASQSIPATGGTGSVTLTTAAACGWAATSNVPWIVITSGTTGTGSGTISYSAGADATGVRSGTLTIGGQTFTLNEGSGTGVLTITTPAALPNGVVNQPYSATLAASGGNPPYTWSITSAGLPAGLALNPSTGVISGAPTATGTTSITASVKDNNGLTASMVISLTITASSSTLAITNAAFPNGVIGQSYKQSLTSTGGVVTPFAPYPAFSISAGALPAGLNLVRNPDLSSSITGTPTTLGVSSFTLAATDAAADTTAANFTITITGTPIPEQMAVSPAALAFTVQLGSTSTPTPQPLTITGNGGVLSYTSVNTTVSGGNWLVAQNSPNGNTVGTLDITVANYSNLSPGTYAGTVTVSSAASNSPIAVPVTLTVLAVPSLTISPQQLTVSQGQSTASNVTVHNIQVSAASQGTSGTTSIGFNATVATNASWLTLSPSTGTTPATLTASIDSGGLAIGAYTGIITITPSSGTPETVTVTLNVINPQMLSAAPAPVAFTYVLGATSPGAQSVTVSSSSGPTLNLTAAVATADKNNWLFVNPTTGTTPLELSVSVNADGLIAGTYQGTITVTASDDSVVPLPIPVVLTVVPAVPTIASVTNAASFAPGPVAPGEMVTIFGSGLGPATGVTGVPSAGKIGSSLGGTQVFFNSFAAPVIYSSEGQVSVIVPYELSGASAASVQLQYQSLESAAVDVRVIDSVPGIFTLNASGQGAIVNQNGKINSSTNGAPIGSTVSIYATGEGQTNPPGIDGEINAATLPLPAPVAKVTVQIGGLPANVTYAGAAPLDVAGILQVNATLPAGLPAGTSVPVVITVGTEPSQAGVTIAIHP